MSIVWNVLLIWLLKGPRFLPNPFILLLVTDNVDS